MAVTCNTEVLTRPSVCRFPHNEWHLSQGDKEHLPRCQKVFLKVIQDSLIFNNRPSSMHAGLSKQKMENPWNIHEMYFLKSFCKLRKRCICCSASQMLKAWNQSNIHYPWTQQSCLSPDILRWFFYITYVAIHKHLLHMLQIALYMLSSYENLLMFKNAKLQTFFTLNKTVGFVFFNKKRKDKIFPFCVSCKEVCMYLLVLGDICKKLISKFMWEIWDTF